MTATTELARAQVRASRVKAAGNKLSLLTSVMSFLAPSILPGFAGFNSSNAGAVKASRSPKLVAELQAKAEEKRTDRQRRNIRNAMRMGLIHVEGD